MHGVFRQQVAKQWGGIYRGTVSGYLRTGRMQGRRIALGQKRGEAGEKSGKEHTEKAKSGIESGQKEVTEAAKKGGEEAGKESQKATADGIQENSGRCHRRLGIP